MNQNDSDKKNHAVYKLVGDLYNITAIYNANEETILTLFPIYNNKISIKHLKDRLQLAGYSYTIQEEEEHILLRLNSNPTFKSHLWI